MGGAQAGIGMRGNHIPDLTGVGSSKKRLRIASGKKEYVGWGKKTKKLKKRERREVQPTAF